MIYNVYKQTPNGWISIMVCQGFSHACKVANNLNELTNGKFCVNGVNKRNIQPTGVC